MINANHSKCKGRRWTNQPVSPFEPLYTWIFLRCTKTWMVLLNGAVGPRTFSTPPSAVARFCRLMSKLQASAYGNEEETEAIPT